MNTEYIGSQIIISAVSKMQLFLLSVFSTSVKIRFKCFTATTIHSVPLICCKNCFQIFSISTQKNNKFYSNIWHHSKHRILILSSLQFYCVPKFPEKQHITNNIKKYHFQTISRLHPKLARMKVYWSVISLDL